MTESGAQELAAWVEHYRRLRLLCAEDDLADARLYLRRGRFADAGRLTCAGPDLAGARQQSWLHVDRLARTQDDGRPVLFDALSGLAHARVTVSLLVAGGAGLFVGLPAEAADVAGWLRSVIAPGSLARPVPVPDLSAFGREVNGLRLTLVPAPQGRPDGDRGASALPGLGRLLLSPGTGWAALVRLEPVGAGPLMSLRAELAACAQELGGRTSSSRSDDLGLSVTLERPDVARLLEHVTTRLAHLETGEESGLWQATVHVGATSGPTVDMVTSVLGSLLAEEPTTGGRWVSDRLVEDRDADVPPPSSILATADLEALLAPPRDSVPGLRTGPPPPAGRTALHHDRPVPIGHWHGTAEPFALGLDDLEGHAFVTGTTGSGKSTTAQRLLAGLWNDHRIPFLVIDPVKADYEAVAPALRDDLVLVDAADLRMNVLAPYPGFPARTHLELVANAFVGSFRLPTPVPYIVAQLFELMVDRADAQPPTTLHELRDLLDPFVTALGYDGEITSNIRASLGTRLGLLLSPAKAERVAAPASTMLEPLFRSPSVVALSGLGDDEERAFLMTMLSLFVYERARTLGRPTGAPVRHVTVLEEAHRVLPEPRPGGDPESGSAGDVSALLLTRMLAEIRSYGEAFVVVDQSPGAVARDVVRNTNLKIAHRVLDAEDREVIAGSMGIGDEHRDSIGLLDRGEMVVASRRLPGPQTVAVDPAARVRSAPGRVRGPATADGDDGDPRTCCGGNPATTHHAAERRSREAEGVLALAVAGLIAGAGGRDELWDEVDTQVDALTEGDPVLCRDRGTARRCLVWVGLRRSIGQFVEHGALAPEEIRRHLDAGFAAWRGRRDHRAFARLRAARDGVPGPFHGCRHCPARCLYRHVAAAAPGFGTAELNAAVASPWDEAYESDTMGLVGSALGAGVALRGLFGDAAAAQGVAVCALTQVLHGRGAPVAEQDRLLTLLLDASRP